MFTKKTADSNSVYSAEGSCSTCSTASSRPAKDSPPEVLRSGKRTEALRVTCLGKRPKVLRAACLDKHPNVGLAFVFRYAAIGLALLLACLCALSLMYRSQLMQFREATLSPSPLK